MVCTGTKVIFWQLHRVPTPLFYVGVRTAEDNLCGEQGEYCPSLTGWKRDPDFTIAPTRHHV